MKAWLIVINYYNIDNNNNSNNNNNNKNNNNNNNDIVPHSWIEKCMNIFGVAVNVRSFISESMKYWNTELNAGQSRLGNVKIKRGMFYGDSLSPLLFVMTMIPLTLMLRKTNIFYEVKKKGERINHLLFMDDLKLRWSLAYQNVAC